MFPAAGREAAMAHLTGDAKVQYVRGLFSRIAGRYDLLNSVMTARMHYRWKALTAQLAAAGVQGPALDVATGTGDIAFGLARRPGVSQVVGVDFAPPMLAIARRRAGAQRRGVPVGFVLGDALTLPFPDASFGCVTTGFSLRNVASVERLLQEMYRILVVGGRLCVLETTPVEPQGISPRLFRFYFHRVVPLMGALLAGDREAYTYLPRSVDRFPKAEGLAYHIRQAGFAQVSYTLVGLGTVAIHLGVKA